MKTHMGVYSQSSYIPLEIYAQLHQRTQTSCLQSKHRGCAQNDWSDWQACWWCVCHWKIVQDEQRLWQDWWCAWSLPSMLVCRQRKDSHPTQRTSLNAHAAAITWRAKSIQHWLKIRIRQDSIKQQRSPPLSLRVSPHTTLLWVFQVTFVAWLCFYSTKKWKKARRLSDQSMYFKVNCSCPVYHTGNPQSEDGDALSKRQHVCMLHLLHTCSLFVGLVTVASPFTRKLMIEWNRLFTTLICEPVHYHLSQTCTGISVLRGPVCADHWQMKDEHGPKLQLATNSPTAFYSNT